MIKPLHDYVLLEKVEAEKKTASGIVLTEASKEKPSYAIVKAVGEGKLVDGQLVKPTVAVNDKVVYKYTDSNNNTTLVWVSRKHLGNFQFLLYLVYSAQIFLFLTTLPLLMIL